jgi:LmbE family N-acetylglucosaminyl deacetylase
MKFLHFNRVLVISPHPDDAEYSMGGTILRFEDTIFDVVCLTNGGDHDPSTLINRHDEVWNAWRVAKPRNVNPSFSPFKRLGDTDVAGWVNYLDAWVKQSGPYDCIMTTSEMDSHFEHRIVAGFGYALIREKPISIIEYYSPSTLETWIPNIFVGISDVYERKLAMLKEFTSQQHRLYFNGNVVDEFHTHYQQAKRGISKVEKFRLITTTIK